MFPSAATLLQVALLAAGLSSGEALRWPGSCESLTDCRQCLDSSATCGWCQAGSSADSRCVSLQSPQNASLQCRRECGAARPARAVGDCDDTACRGVKGETCSGHGTCKCGTCECEPDFSGRVCQNCPSRHESCPIDSPCCIGELCLPLAACATCVKNERKATHCDACPPDTRLVQTDPGEPQSTECKFGSMSLSANSHCSYRVYYWHDERLVLHVRIQLDCGSVEKRPLFGGQVPAPPPPNPSIDPEDPEEESEWDPDLALEPEPATTAAPPPEAGDTTSTSRGPQEATSAPAKSDSKEGQAGTTRQEGEGKTSVGSRGSAPWIWTVVTVCLWTARGALGVNRELAP